MELSQPYIPIINFIFFKISLRVSRHQTVTNITTPSSESYDIILQHIMGNKIAILEVTPNTQDISSVRLPTQGMTYMQKCFRQRTEGQESPGAGADMVYLHILWLN